MIEVLYYEDINYNILMSKELNGTDILKFIQLLTIVKYIKLTNNNKINKTKNKGKAIQPPVTHKMFLR